MRPCETNCILTSPHYGPCKRALLVLTVVDDGETFHVIVKTHDLDEAEVVAILRSTVAGITSGALNVN